MHVFRSSFNFNHRENKSFKWQNEFCYTVNVWHLNLLREFHTVWFYWQNLRPEIPRCCPSGLASIMRKCWDANADKRPEMDEVVRMLEAIDTSKGGGMIPDDQASGCFCFATARGPWSFFSSICKHCWIDGARKTIRNWWSCSLDLLLWQFYLRSAKLILVHQ